MIHWRTEGILFIYFMAHGHGAWSINIWVLTQHSIFLRGQKWEAVSWPTLFPHIFIYKGQIKGRIGIYMNYREPLYYWNGCDSYACHLCLPMKLVLVYGIKSEVFLASTYIQPNSSELIGQHSLVQTDNDLKHAANAELFEVGEKVECSAIS